MSLFHGMHASTPPQSPGTKDERARDRARQVDQRLDRALLTMEAMWTLLRDKLGVTDEQLVERVIELDLSDGVLDGQVRRPPLQCPECDRTISRRFPRCLYCGTELQHDPFS